MKGSNVRSYVSRLRLLFIIINICQECSQVSGVREAKINLDIQFPETSHISYISHPIQGSCTTDMDEGRQGELMLFLRGIGRNELYMLKNPKDNPSHADAVVKPGSVRWQGSSQIPRKGFIFKFCPRLYGVHAVSCEYMSAKAKGQDFKAVKPIYLVEKPILKVLYHQQPNIAFLGGKLTVNCLAAVGSLKGGSKGRDQKYGELTLIVSGGRVELKWHLSFHFVWRDASYSGWRMKSRGNGNGSYVSMTREFDVNRGYIYNAVLRLPVTKALERSTFECRASNLLRERKTKGIPKGLVIKDTPVNMKIISRMIYSPRRPPMRLFFAECIATRGVNIPLAMVVKTVSQTHVYMANRKSGGREYKHHVFQNPNYKGIIPKTGIKFITKYTKGFFLDMVARLPYYDHVVKVSCRAERILVCQNVMAAQSSTSELRVEAEEHKTVSKFRHVSLKFVVLVVLGLCIALFIIAANTVRKKSPAVEK